MRVSLRQLKKMGVETVSGAKLGRICDAVFETDGQTILQYEVREFCFVGKKYLISNSQVVRFEEKKMVVDDGVRPIEVNNERVKSEKVSVEPVMMSELKD